MYLLCKSRAIRSVFDLRGPKFLLARSDFSRASFCDNPRSLSAIKVKVLDGFIFDLLNVGLLSLKGKRIAPHTAISLMRVRIRIVEPPLKYQLIFEILIHTLNRWRHST